MRTQACLECLAEVRSRVRCRSSHDVRVHPRGLRLRALRDRRRGRRGDEPHRRRPPDRGRPGLAASQLVAPTTPDERIRLAAERTDGWLYLVSLTGTTRARAEVLRPARRARRACAPVTEVPCSRASASATPEQAAEAASLADGIVVGAARSRSPTRAGLRRCAGTSLHCARPWTPRRRLSPSRL